MSLEMPQGLRWLGYLAGTAWPEGDEDKLFALAQDWHTAATDLQNLISAVQAACDTALDNYSGSGREQMASQFEALLSGDQSVDAIAKNLQQIGDSVQDCGTQIEYTKLQVISTLAIMAAEIAWALATLWGAFAVPAIEAEGAGILQIVGRALTNRLIAHAARVAEMPLWKLAAIEVVEQAGIGFVQDLAIQEYQKNKGHRSGIDWKQTITTAAVAGISAGVATPVGHYLGAGLGNWVGRDSMTWWKSSGIAVASAVPAGLAGAGAGIVANGVITGEWEFDPAALLGGVGGGLVGGVHGVIGHATQTRLNSLSLGGGFSDGSFPKGDDPAGSLSDLSGGEEKWGGGALVAGRSGGPDSEPGPGAGDRSRFATAAFSRTLEPEGADRTRPASAMSARSASSASIAEVAHSGRVSATQPKSSEFSPSTSTRNAAVPRRSGGSDETSTKTTVSGSRTSIGATRSQTSPFGRGRSVDATLPQSRVSASRTGIDEARSQPPLAGRSRSVDEGSRQSRVSAPRAGVDEARLQPPLSERSRSVDETPQPSRVSGSRASLDEARSQPPLSGDSRRVDEMLPQEPGFARSENVDETTSSRGGTGSEISSQVSVSSRSIDDGDVLSRASSMRASEVEETSGDRSAKSLPNGGISSTSRESAISRLRGESRANISSANGGDGSSVRRAPVATLQARPQPVDSMRATSPLAESVLKSAPAVRVSDQTAESTEITRSLTGKHDDSGPSLGGSRTSDFVDNSRRAGLAGDGNDSETKDPKVGSSLHDSADRLSTPELVLVHHLPADPDHQLRSPDDDGAANLNACGPLALAKIVELTGSTVARVPQDRVGRSGMSALELEHAAGAPLHPFDDHDSIGDHLLDLGPGSVALVVDAYRGRTDRYGVGAHAYLMHNSGGEIRVVDPATGQRHSRTSSDIRSTHAILYTERGVPHLLPEQRTSRAERFGAVRIGTHRRTDGDDIAERRPGDPPLEQDSTVGRLDGEEKPETIAAELNRQQTDGRSNSEKESPLLSDKAVRVAEDLDSPAPPEDSTASEVKSDVTSTQRQDPELKKQSEKEPDRKEQPEPKKKLESQKKPEPKKKPEPEKEPESQKELEPKEKLEQEPVHEEEAELPWDIPKIVITPSGDDLPVAVREFGSQRDGAKDLTNIVPIPQETVEWLHEQIFHMVEGDRGVDEKFRESVRRVLTQRLLSSDASVWPQLMSATGMPLRVKYRGSRYPISLRVSLRALGPSKEQIAPLSDGPPVGIQQWAFGIVSSADTSSNGDYRAFSYAYNHTFPADHGALTYVALGGELDLVNNQVSTSVTVTSTVQPMVIIRSKGRSWPFDYAMTWELSHGDSLADSLSPTPADRVWYPTVSDPAKGMAGDPPNNMLVWFPNYLKVGAIPMVNEKIASTVPAPMSRAVGEFHLYGPVTIPNHSRIMADVMSSFRADLSGMSDNSMAKFREFFGEGNFRSLITAAARTPDDLPSADETEKTGDEVATTGDEKEKDESTIISPTFYTSSGKTIGALQISVVLHGGEEITGPTTEKSVLESFVLRSLGMQGSSVTANSLGFNPSLGFGFGGKEKDPSTGIQSLGGQFTIKGGASQKFSHTLSYGGSARIAHSLRTGEPLLHVTPQMTVHVKLIRPNSRAVDPAPGTALAGGHDYPVNMLVPSLETFGHAPTAPLYLPSEILHLRQLGVSTTPLAVHGAKPLFAEVKKWMSGLGFFPPDRDAPSWGQNKLGWLSDKTTLESTHTERLDNLRKFEQMSNQLGLRGGLDEAIEGGERIGKDGKPTWDGGAPTWFELPTSTGTKRISVFLITERRYLSDDPHEGVSHEWTLPKVQTLNYSGSTIPGDEQFSKTPAAWNVGGNFSVTSPFDEKARLLFQGFTPDYTLSGGKSEIRDSNSGTGHEYYTLSPTENGTQIFGVPVRHRIVLTYSHGSAPDDLVRDGDVRLAVPTYRTHTEKFDEMPVPTFREFEDEDARRLALPSAGRSLEDNVFRPPDTTIYDRVGGSREVRKAAFDLIDDIALELEQEAASSTSSERSEETSPELESIPDDPSPEEDAVVPRIIRTFPDDSEEFELSFVDPATGRAFPAFDFDFEDDAPAPGFGGSFRPREVPRITFTPPESRDGHDEWHEIDLHDDSSDNGHEVDLRDAGHDDSQEHEIAEADNRPMPGTFPVDDDTAGEGSEPALTWPQVRDFLQSSTHWAVGQAGDMGYRVGRWLWRNAVGEPATNPESMAHEAIHTGLSPYHMNADAPRIFRDSYVAVEGASTPGTLAGTDITVKTTGYLTNVRVRPRPPKMDAERWLQSVNGAGHTDTNQLGHQWGASLTESVGKVDRNVIPGAAYHYSTSYSHSDTVNDNSAVFRVTTEDTTPVHWFVADAHYLVNVRVGVRNLARGLIAGGPHIDRTRVVDMPDAVEFLLVDNDLQNNPDLLALVNDSNLEAGFGQEYGDIAEANPPDRGLPIAYVKGKRIGYGAVTNVEVEGGRDAYQKLALELVEKYAPGITKPGSANYLAGVETRINEHTTTLALRTLPNAGPDGRTAFHLIDRTRPFDPHLVEVTFSARPDPSVDLSTIRGKRVTSTSGVDNIFGHSNGDGAALEVPGATRMSDSRKRGHQIDFTLSGQHGGHRPKFDLSVQRQSNLTEIQTSSRERRAWQRSFGNTSEFPVPHEYVVEIRKRPLAEARLAMLVRRGISGFAMAGGGIGLLPPLQLSDLAGLAAPTTESRKSLKAGTLIRFNTSETPEADTLAELPEPGLYRSDPSIRPPASTEGDAVIEMEVAPAVQKLLSGPTWVPTRGIEIYEFEGVPELAQALRQVDPSLDIDDRMVSNRSSEGMFIRLTTLVESNRLTLLGPAATAPFLNTRSQREAILSGPAQPDGDHAGPTSVKITLYSPQIEKSGKDIAIDDIWWAGDGFETEADNSINTTANFSLSSPYTGEGNDRGAFTIPLTGEHAGAGQFNVITSNRRELLRFGTPMEGPAPEEGGDTVGTIGHRLRALAKIEVRGPKGTLWVSGDALIRTTETPPGLELRPVPPVEDRLTKEDLDTREEQQETDTPPNKSSDHDDSTEPEDPEFISKKSDSEAKPDTETETKSEAEAKARTEAELRAKAEAEARARSEAQARTRAEGEARDKSDAEAKTKAAEAKSGGKGIETESGDHHPAPASGDVRRPGLRSGTVGRIPAPAGHVWESMPPDGDCFFYALERVVYHDDPPATVAELDRRIRGLRAEVAHEMRADPDTYFRSFHTILSAAEVPGARDLERTELRALLRARNTVRLRDRFYEQIEATTNRRVWRNAVSHLVPQAATAVLARRGLTLRVQNDELRATGGWTLGENTSATPDATTLVHGSHYYLAVPTGDHTPGSAPRAADATLQSTHPPVRDWDELDDLLGPAVQQHTPRSYRESSPQTTGIVVLGDESGARYIWLPPADSWPGEMHDATDQPVSLTLEQVLTDSAVTVVRTPGLTEDPATTHDPDLSLSDRSSATDSSAPHAPAPVVESKSLEDDGSLDTDPVEKSFDPSPTPPPSPTGTAVFAPVRQEDSAQSGNRLVSGGEDWTESPSFDSSAMSPPSPTGTVRFSSVRQDDSDLSDDSSVYGNDDRGVRPSPPDGPLHSTVGGDGHEFDIPFRMGSELPTASEVNRTDADPNSTGGAERSPALQRPVISSEPPPRQQSDDETRTDITVSDKMQEKSDPRIEPVRDDESEVTDVVDRPFSLRPSESALSDAAESTALPGAESVLPAKPLAPEDIRSALRFDSDDDDAGHEKSIVPAADSAVLSQETPPSHPVFEPITATEPRTSGDRMREELRTADSAAVQAFPLSRDWNGSRNQWDSFRRSSPVSNESITHTMSPLPRRRTLRGWDHISPSPVTGLRSFSLLPAETSLGQDPRLSDLLDVTVVPSEPESRDITDPTIPASDMRPMSDGSTEVRTDDALRHTDDTPLATEGRPFGTNGRSLHTDGTPLRIDNEPSGIEDSSLGTDGRSLRTDDAALRTDDTQLVADGRPLGNDARLLRSDGRPLGIDGGSLGTYGRSLRIEGARLRTDDSLLGADRRPLRADGRSVRTDDAPLGTDGRFLHTDDASLRSHATARTDGALHASGSPKRASNSRTPLQRLRRLVSRLHGRETSGDTTAGVDPRSVGHAPHRHLRDIFRRPLSRFRSRTTTSTGTTQGDGATPRTSVTNFESLTTRRIRTPSDTVADALSGIQRDTGSTVIRPPKQPAPLTGRSRRDVERAAGGRLRGYPDDHRISRQLELLGPGAQALVVAVHPTGDANGVGAYAYRMFDRNGTTFVHDTTDHTHTLPGQRTPASVHAILYTGEGVISRPVRLRDETIPEFPRNARIGARPDIDDDNWQRPQRSPATIDRRSRLTDDHD
ncbi:hypothetical protein ACFYXQ_32815 [Nocardia jiangxiensis]|uniref:Papain fold toxin 1, glutamine deamidase n=1 Tax=Nocardia jiangxiensis TaxID=282685 RepID=A0ABW6S8E7_9NOCA